MQIDSEKPSLSDIAAKILEDNFTQSDFKKWKSDNSKLFKDTVATIEAKLWVHKNGKDTKVLRETVHMCLKRVIQKQDEFGTASRYSKITGERIQNLLETNLPLLCIQRAQACTGSLADVREVTHLMNSLCQQVTKKKELQLNNPVTYSKY